MQTLKPVQVSFSETSVYVNQSVKRDNDTDSDDRPRLLHNIGLNLKKSKNYQKQILYNLSGVFKPGRLCVILGGSGAGKSVLLNVLAGNGKGLSDALVSANVYVNSHYVKDGRFMSEISGYVQQDDIFHDSMTVEECIMMSAKLRRPDLDLEQKKWLVEQVMIALLIDHIRSSRVGSASKRGISGGEKKRVSIAMELVANPPILYLDEPTSGLDSFSALLVIRILKRLAAQGRTIIATIHTPSSQMFELFDDLIILGNGRIIYQGPQNEMRNYFQSIGFEFPPHTNPADHVFVSILRKEDEQETIENSIDRIDQLSEKFKSSQYQQQIDNQIQNKPIGLIDESLLKKTDSFGKQLGFLVNRSVKELVRNPMSIFIRILSTLGLSVFIALVYLNLGRNTAISAEAFLQSVSGVLFFILINQTFLSFNFVLHVFGDEKPLFEREYGAGYYSVTPYFLSKIFIQIPFQILYPILLSFIVYWIIGFRPGFDRFLLFALFVTLIALFGAVLGLMLGAMFKTVDFATVVGPLVILPLVILGGFFVNLSVTPVWLVWIQWISPIQYAFTGLVDNELQGRDVNGVSGDEYLDQIGASSRLPLAINIIFVCLIILFCTLIAYISLIRSVYKAGIARRDVQKERKQIEKGKNKVNSHSILPQYQLDMQQVGNRQQNYI